MKTLLILYFSILASATEPPQVGILKCRDSQAFHGIYFSKNKTWVGNNVLDDGDLESIAADRAKEKAPATFAQHVTFDGQSIETLNLPLRSERLKSISKTIAEKCQWQKRHGRETALLTTNQKSFSDPEHWKISSFEKLKIKSSDLEKIFKDYEACTKKPSLKSKAPEILIRHFKSGRIYETSDNKQSLIEFRNLCPEIAEDAIQEYTKDSPAPWSVWLYRNNKGPWQKYHNLNLVDIGDFDGDGKSEGVFRAGFAVPQGFWALITFTDPGNVVLASDGGY